MKSRAMVMVAYGGPEVLQLDDVDVVRKSANDVLLRVLAVSVNHLDIDIREGISRMPLALPHVLGREIVGEVIEPAEDGEFHKGDHVIVLPNAPCGRCSLCLRGRSNLCKNSFMPGITAWGGYSEFVTAPDMALVPIGKLDPVIAAAVPISFGTAWRMLYSIGDAKPGDNVLISGAAGGLGHAAVQLARLGGAHVVGLIGDPAKAGFVEKCGAAVTVSTRKSDWVDQAMEATNGRGYDLIIEHVGGSIFEACVGLLAVTGRMMVGGGHAGEHPRLDVIETFRNELQFFGVRSQRPDEVKKVLSLAAGGQIKPSIDQVLSLADAAKAHVAITQRSVRGKQVLVP